MWVETVEATVWVLDPWRWCVQPPAVSIAWTMPLHALLHLWALALWFQCIAEFHSLAMQPCMCAGRASTPRTVLVKMSSGAVCAECRVSFGWCVAGHISAGLLC